MKQREKYLLRLPKALRDNILTGLKAIVSGHTEGMNVKKMVNRKNEYRRKVNDRLRVIYTDENGKIVIIKI